MCTREVVLVGIVVAVSRSASHSMIKGNQPEIRLLEGVAGAPACVVPRPRPRYLLRRFRRRPAGELGLYQPKHPTAV